MDFENEPYVRFYRKDTATMRLIDWQGQAVLPHLLRLVDTAGFLTCSGLDPVTALHAILVQWPVDVIQVGLENLIRYGVVVYTPTTDTLFLPRFVEAQTCVRTDRARQQDVRNRRVAKAKAEILLTRPELASQLSRLANGEPATMPSSLGGDQPAVSSPATSHDVTLESHSVTDPSTDPPESPDTQPSRSVTRPDGQGEVNSTKPPQNSTEATEPEASVTMRDKTSLLSLSLGRSLIEIDQSGCARDSVKQPDIPNGQVRRDEYRPARQLLERALAGGMDQAAFDETLARYRKVGQIDLADQSKHDRAFGAWVDRGLESATKARRRGNPAPIATTGDAGSGGNGGRPARFGGPLQALAESKRHLLRG